MLTQRHDITSTQIINEVTHLLALQRSPESRVQDLLSLANRWGGTSNLSDYIEVVGHPLNPDIKLKNPHTQKHIVLRTKQGMMELAEGLGHDTYAVRLGTGVDAKARDIYINLMVGEL